MMPEPPVKVQESDTIEDQLRRRLDELKPAHDEYLRVRRALDAYLREPSTSANRNRGNAVGELAIAVVLAANHPMRPVDVLATLREQGHPATADSVSNALYYAARAGKLARLGRGQYASPDQAENT